MSDPRWALVHAPDDPAVAAWIAAAAAVDAPKPRLVPWADVLNGSATFDDGELVHAERLTPVVPTRYGGSRDRYDRLAAALATLNDRLAADNATSTADASATLLALDRKRCTEHLAAAGLPVPVAATGKSVVRQRFAEPCDAMSWLSAHGDGVSTSLALARTRGGYELRHTLRVRYYPGGTDDPPGSQGHMVRDLLARDDETFAVGELPTTYFDSAQQRFRFAVIDGRVTHAAGRNADTLVAREYFGGRRREIDAYRERFGAEAWHRLIDLAEQAAAAFPGLRALGVDLAAGQIDGQVDGPDLGCEIDPFGARLPAALGLPGTAGEGLEVAATTLRCWMAR